MLQNLRVQTKKDFNRKTWNYRANLNISFDGGNGQYAYFFTSVTRDVCYFSRIDRFTGNIERVHSFGLDDFDSLRSNIGLDGEK